MKIIQVTPQYPPYLGGMPNCVRQISEKLANKGYGVEVFTSDIECKRGKLKSTKNLKINYLKSLEIAHVPFSLSLFFRLLKTGKDSIIHLHLGQAYFPEVVFLISKIKKIPYIAHVHSDPIPTGMMGFLLPMYKKLFLKKVLSKANIVVCLTEEDREFINKKYSISKNKMVVIPNGIGKNFFITKEKKDSMQTVNLLFVGRLSEEKNLPRLINAISLMKERVALHIVGDGQKKAEIKKLISDEKLNNVILHGKKTNKDLLNFYKSADIFVLSSDYEGLPLVLLEAMATGLPIVASDIRGVHEFVGDCGILVNPPTPEDFASTIDSLIKNKNLRKKLAKKGKEKAKQHDWSKIMEKFENVYREVTNEANKK